MSCFGGSAPHSPPCLDMDTSWFMLQDGITQSQSCQYCAKDPKVFGMLFKVQLCVIGAVQLQVWSNHHMQAERHRVL